MAQHSVLYPGYTLPETMRDALKPFLEERRKATAVYVHHTPFSVTSEPTLVRSFRETLPHSALSLGVHLLLSHVNLYCEQQLNHPPRDDGFRHTARVALIDVHIRGNEAVVSFGVTTQLVPGSRAPRHAAPQLLLA